LTSLNSTIKNMGTDGWLRIKGSICKGPIQMYPVGWYSFPYGDQMCVELNRVVIFKGYSRFLYRFWKKVWHSLVDQEVRKELEG